MTTRIEWVRGIRDLLESRKWDQWQKQEEAPSHFNVATLIHPPSV